MNENLNKHITYDHYLNKDALSAFFVLVLNKNLIINFQNSTSEEHHGSLIGTHLKKCISKQSTNIYDDIIESLIQYDHWNGELSLMNDNEWVYATITRDTDSTTDEHAIILIGLPVDSYKKSEEKYEELEEFFQETRVAMLNVMEDIEDEKAKAIELAAELTKYKHALDGISEIVVIADPEGNVIYTNTIFETKIGISADKINGTHVSHPALWSGINNNNKQEDIWPIIKKNKSPHTVELVKNTKDGKQYDAQLSITPILNSKNKIQFYIGIERDITKEKELDRSKNEFISLASHELRTPLTALSWHTEFLAEEMDTLSEAQQLHIAEIQQSSKRMTNLVNALLNASRIEMGTFSINPSQTNLNKSVKELIDEQDFKIQKKKIKVKIKSSPETIKMQTDKNALSIVIGNLISNAIKYSNEKGTITITLIAKNKGQIFQGRKVSKASVGLSISDKGIGIPKSEQSNIFKKLYRASNVLHTETRGTGLGLYLSKSIIDQIEGDIWFKSTVNKGTTFYCLIPKRIR